MKLYHFTSSHHLYGISRHGLTVGDVPTDISKAKGRCGVWLTSDPSSAGHGLEGSSVDKTRFRMTVHAPDTANLVKWTDWAAANVTTDTRRVLHSVGVGFETWFVFFGIIDRSAITECVDMVSGLIVADWADRDPLSSDVKPVAPWRREAWLTKTIKQANREARRRRIQAQSGVISEV
jgi:hypothetical protein